MYPGTNSSIRIGTNVPQGTMQLLRAAVYPDTFSILYICKFSLQVKSWKYCTIAVVTICVFSQVDNEKKEC